MTTDQDHGNPNTDCRDETASRSVPSGGASTRDAAEPTLSLAFRADRPLEPAHALGLSQCSHLTIGRGNAGTDHVEVRSDGIAVTGSSSGRTFVLNVPDPRISRLHATLQRANGRWHIADHGSKNGILINGNQVREAVLIDGDVVEIGHCFFVYRQAGLRVARETRPATSQATPPTKPISLHPRLAQAYATLVEIAPSDVSILVGGETGSGKEVIAKAIHALSARRGAFCAVNCGGIPENLVESEFFGHRKGAFSGAIEERLGWIRSADEGTLFLDEIAELPLAAQAALLRALQEREVVPVGSSRPIPVRFRVIAATHRNLYQLSARGQFREDLLARIAGFHITVPPLRQRREDLGMLVASILGRLGAHDVSFSLAAARVLVAHNWPRNIRELENALRTAVTLSHGGVIDLDQVQAVVREPGARQASAAVSSRQRSEQVVGLLREHHGNVTAVARALGTTRMQIHRWSDRLGIEIAAYRRRG